MNWSLLNRAMKDSSDMITWATLPKITASKPPLQQVFQNLITNALKCQNPEVEPVVEAKVADKGNEWLFSFSDNGIGIEEQFFS